MALGMELGDRLVDSRWRHPRERSQWRTRRGPTKEGLVAVVVAIVAVVVAQDVSSAQGETASQMRGVRAVDPMPAEPTGRRFYVVVGIDNYKSWPRLHTAVSDAKGVAKVLEERYGFSAVAPPLFDGRATRLQIESLFNDVLPHKLRDLQGLFKNGDIICPGLRRDRER